MKLARTQNFVAPITDAVEGLRLCFRCQAGSKGSFKRDLMQKEMGLSALLVQALQELRL